MAVRDWVDIGWEERITRQGLDWLFLLVSNVHRCHPYIMDVQTLTYPNTIRSRPFLIQLDYFLMLYFPNTAGLLLYFSRMDSFHAAAPAFNTVDPCPQHYTPPGQAACPQAAGWRPWLKSSASPHWCDIAIPAPIFASALAQSSRWALVYLKVFLVC